MEFNYNTSLNFVLSGIDELEGFKYQCCALLLLMYLFILLSGAVIIVVVSVNESLHGPMYTLIVTLVINGIFGSSSFFPKLILDLLLSSRVISRVACFIQSFLVTLFVYCETSTFCIMAFDTYVAVCHPLRYAIFMTTETVLKLIAGFLITSLTLIIIGLYLTIRLPLCGSRINNIFCDNMSIFILSCVDTSVNKLYGVMVFTIYFTFTIFIIVYSYLQVFYICFQISKEASKKAIHTLVTHFLNFFIFLMGVLFNMIRYRLENINLPLIIQILLSATTLVFPPLLNPLIYGIRTKSLRVKVIRYLRRIKWRIHF